MSTENHISTFRSLNSLAKKLRKDLKKSNPLGTNKKAPKDLKKSNPLGTNKKAPKENDFVLIFAHNGIGKTRLSVAFKDIGKKRRRPDTLYFNAFTEDLFDWDNDLEGDKERNLEFKSRSNFFNGLDGLDFESHIRPYLQCYADFDFAIDHEKSIISFSREVLVNGKNETIDHIKISRGEENVFIWCFFLAIAKLAIEAEKGQPYYWVKYIYIDDPISSLDEQNTIALASDLAKLLKTGKDRLRTVVSTHHGLFFNVMFNELSSSKAPDGTKVKISKKAYILHRPQKSQTYELHDTGETPFLHHVAALSELKRAADHGNLYQYHFNMLRSALEKTAVFFGHQHISTCFNGLPQKDLYSRILNIKSHSKYSIYDPTLMHADEKKQFREILNAFLDRYKFLFPPSPKRKRNP